MFKELLAAEYAPYGILSELQLRQLEAHYISLTRWNARLNLTRIRSLEDTVRFHYCESLFLGRSLPPGGQHIVDVGSGGGFPGIPVAILRPECEVTLVEAHQRKSVFLRDCSRELKNVHVVAKRAEDIGATFDCLVSRAVNPSGILKLRLAGKVTLLMGETDTLNLSGVCQTVPWGNQRVLFHVEHRT